MHDVLPHDRPYAVTLRTQLDCPPAWTGPVTAALAAAGVEVDSRAAVGVGVGPGGRCRPRSTTGPWPRSPTCSSA